MSSTTISGGDFLIAAAGLGAAAYALSCLKGNNKESPAAALMVKENFEGMPKRVVEVQPIANGASVPMNYHHMMSTAPAYTQKALCGQMAAFSGQPEHYTPAAPGGRCQIGGSNHQQQPSSVAQMRQQGIYGSSNFEATVSPRFGPAEGYRGNIRYNLPSYGNMAVPKNPIQFGAMVDGGVETTKEGYHAGKALKKQSAAATVGGVSVVNSLPASTMNTLDAAGNQQQVIVQNRFMFANQKSRFSRDADWIRGDLPIVKRTGDWYVSSANPSTALRQGAMQIIGGQFNQTANALSNMKSVISGGSNTDYNLVNQASGKFSNTGDIQFTAFP